MLALTQKAEVDLLAIADLYPGAVDTLSALDTLSGNPASGTIGFRPDIRELALPGLPFQAIFTRVSGWIVVYRVLPKRFQNS